MKTSELQYPLPEERIAQTPIEPRDSSRILYLNRNQPQDSYDQGVFRDIVDHLDSNDVLVLNNTQVIPARLKGYTIMGNGEKKDIECILIKNLSDTRWEVMCFPGERLKPGRKMFFKTERRKIDEGFWTKAKTRKLKAEVMEITYTGRIVEFNVGKDELLEIIDGIGETPLPPYIYEKIADISRYQTVFSQEKWSAAAPTASLHFTPELLQKIQDKWVTIEYITLHVGPGTFKPLDVENVADHQIHSEQIFLDAEVAKRLNEYKKSGKRIVAGGTTTTRALESFVGPDSTLKSGSMDTDLYITPGYEFQIVDALITNFHVPGSTLLCLVGAFTGLENLLDAYEYAIQEEMRFLSFGDCMMIS